MKAVTPQSLAEHAYVGREPGSGTREVIDHYLQKAGVAPDGLQLIMELGSPEAIKGLLSTGNGFAIMSRAIVARELRAGALACIPLSPPLTRHFSVVYPKERFHSRLVNSFVEFAKQRLAAQQGATQGVAALASRPA
jgi:DNA-binding transcriptional LysR family regulator